MYKKECDDCVYKDWDCKNCFIDFDKGNRNVTFFFIMTRQCNFRCNYCGINFTDDNLNYEVIDNFLFFLEKNRKLMNEIRLEFFGGEPLLEYDKIKYIIENTKKFAISGFSIVTNGEYLTEENAIFLQNNNVEIILSIAIHSKKILEKVSNFKINFSSILINFIIEPGKELLMYELFKKLVLKGFRKISLIPIRYTKKRSVENLINLDLLLKKLKILNDGLEKKNIKLGLFTGKNNDDLEKGIGKNDLEIVVDFDGKLYGDYELELYILKDIVNKKVFDFNDIFLGDISDSFLNIEKILNIRNTIKPHFYLNEIAKDLNMLESDLNLGKVMRKYNLNV